MTQRFKKILSKFTRRDIQSNIKEENTPSTNTVQSRRDTQNNPKETFSKAPSALDAEPTTAYPVQKDMILFETLDNIHALFSIPQKN